MNIFIMNASDRLRMRPQSAKRNPSLRSQNKEESRIISSSHTQMSSSKPLYSISRMNAPELRRLIPRKTDMSPERLLEENFILKKRMNELQEGLRLEKTKGETAQRRNAKWKKRLDIEFQKQLYWGQKGEYMVMGVKNQYEKMKKMYEDKCLEVQGVKRDIKYTEIEELRIQLDQYRDEAARLKEEMDKFIEAYKIPYDLEGNDSPASQLLISELRESIDRCEYQVSTYKSGIKSMDKLLRDRDQKIQFLEKLVIDKDNHSHQLEQASKKLNHQTETLRVKNREMKEQQEEERLNLGDRIQEIRDSEERRFQKQLSVFETEIANRDQQIAKLQAQIGYLSTLLTQWKPSQNNQSVRNSVDNRTIEPRASFHLKESNLQSIHDIEELSKSRQLNELSKSSLDQNSQLINSGLHRKAPRVHYTLKRDKVKKQEIEGVCREIKFRLLTRKVDFQTAKQYIRATEGEEISIKDLIQIFRELPFNVQSPERCILLARYLVEDIDESTVYYDEERSAPEVVVRSIFEQVIPKYAIPSAQQEAAIKQKVVEMLSKYHVTLSQVISQHNKQMVVSQKMFTDILVEQQLDMGEEYNDFMMIHMLKKSPGLNQMNFRELLSLIPAKD